MEHHVDATFRRDDHACFSVAGAGRLGTATRSSQLARATVGWPRRWRPRWPDGALRPELSELLERRAWLADAARRTPSSGATPEGARTAREIRRRSLRDEGSFVEYGGLAIAAQRARHPWNELVGATPADGLVRASAGSTGRRRRGPRVVCVLSYEYMVLGRHVRAR